MDSILVTIKKLLGIEDDSDSFDTDIIVNINAAFISLKQLGVGPEAGFSITGVTDLWSDFLGSNTNLEAVKLYIYLNVKLIFDTPANSFVINAYNDQLQKLEWRLKTEVESQLNL